MGPRIFLSFEAESIDEMMTLVIAYAAKHQKPPSWLGQAPDAEALEAEAVVQKDSDLSDEQHDAKHTPPPKSAARKAKSLKIVPASEPEPEPIPEPAPAVEMPSLDALKAMVTAAVKAANPEVLTRLPAFKEKTGLQYIFNATEEHRAALFELALAADLAA